MANENKYISKISVSGNQYSLKDAEARAAIDILNNKPDNDTKYGIEYDSNANKIRLTSDITKTEIDASDFIKDGMINSVSINEKDELVITFNTDAGKEDIIIPLDHLVDIYTGSSGNRINIVVNDDNSIAADLVAGSIEKEYLDDNINKTLSSVDDIMNAITWGEF